MEGVLRGHANHGRELSDACAVNPTPAQQAQQANRTQSLKSCQDRCDEVSVITLVIEVHFYI